MFFEKTLASHIRQCFDKTCQKREFFALTFSKIWKKQFKEKLRQFFVTLTLKIMFKVVVTNVWQKGGLAAHERKRSLCLKFIFQKSNLKYRKIRIAKLLVFLPLIYLWCNSINRTKKILIEKLILIACYWNFYATKQNMKIKKISVIVVKDVVRDFSLSVKRKILDEFFCFWIPDFSTLK